MDEHGLHEVIGLARVVVRHKGLHSPTSPTGNGWEPTPWHATQRAAWEVLRRMNAPLILGLALIAQAIPLSVSELLTNPDRFHGQPVTISGTMANLRESVPGRGTRSYTFDFGDGNQTILVRSLGNYRVGLGQQRWKAPSRR